MIVKRIAQALQSLVRRPSHPFHMVWTALVSSVCLFFMVQSIFVSCFEEVQQVVHEQMKTTYAFLWALLTVDIVFNFFKGIRINGMICEKFWTISMKYLKFRFIIDTVTSIALLISIMLNHPSAAYLRLFIFLKVGDLWRFEKEIFRLTINSSFLRESFTIFKIFLVELFGVHVASCLFYLIGHTLVTKQIYGNAATNSQLYWLTSRLASYPVIQLSVGEQYMWSFYSGASVISTIVIGDIIGHNPIETGFVLILIFIGTISEAYVFGELVNAWSGTYFRIKDYLKHLHFFGKFMRKNRIETSLQHEIQSFMEYKWLEEDYEHREEETRMLFKLPKNIRQSVIISQFSSQLNELSFFSCMPSRLLTQLVDNLTQGYYFRDQVLIDANLNSKHDDLLLICKGNTQGFYQYDSHSQPLLNYYHQNTKIQGIEAFVTGLSGKRMIKAQTRVVTLKINSKRFVQMAREHSEVYQEYQQARHAVVFNSNYSLIKQECECCGQSDHSVFDCKQCHIQKSANAEEDQDNERTKVSKSRLLKSKRIISKINLAKFHSLEEIKRYRIEQEFGKYAKTAWDKLHQLTQIIQSEDRPLHVQTSSFQYPTFQRAHSFERYLPQDNIIFTNE